MDQVRFDGRVAVVTGAGAGLGRSHARLLAARGAKVVVNDLGASLAGRAERSSAADAVVGEITAAGGEAIADTGSVTDLAAMQAMVERAQERFGHVDILVANAGILRDRSFAKLELEDFRAVVETHLMGAVTPLKALWPLFKAQGYGRVVLTTSASGLYGNFGQANYAAAKMALVGLMNALRLEGAKDGIRINAIAPLAATRMTEGLLPPGMAEAMTPEAVSAGVAYLASEDAPDGAVLSAAAGVFSLVRVEETLGADLGAAPTPEAVRDWWADIAAPEGRRNLKDLAAAVAAVAERRTRPSNLVD